VVTAGGFVHGYGSFLRFCPVAYPNQPFRSFRLRQNNLGTPNSQNLLFESWDMPLPEPVIEAHSEGNRIHLKILKSALFYVGKTTVSLSDPAVNILNLTFDNSREVTIECDSDKLAKLTVSFHAQNLFFNHEASTIIK
jgi:hypothetical protein